jgi:tetratricopeptide (TPR) repeat protein
LVQAGAYIGATNLTVEKYITHYDKTWDKLMSYQDRYPLQEYAERSVLTTWKMSYEQVCAVKPEAATLLDQWAFLHPGDISYELVEKYTRYFDSSDEAGGYDFLAIDELSFQDAVGVLAQYSLVDKTEETSSFSIHAVVHDWCLYNIVDDQARERLAVQAIRIVAESIPPSNDIDDLQVALKLLPHARMAATRYNKMREVTSLKLELHQVASFMQDWESSQEVEGLYTRALKGYEEAWGPEHVETLDTVNNLGILYKDQGKLKEAEEMLLRVLRGFEDALGAKHTSTLRTVNNLGNLYKDQGKLKEAEDMYLRALRGYEEAWGAKHTWTLDTINNLGALYVDQDRLKEAEKMLLRVLRGFEEAWGAKHTSPHDTVNNLGLLYRKQGKMKEAEEMYLRALTGYEKTWGAKHASTLLVVSNLGIFYKDQGKLNQAEEMLLRALEGKEEACGAKHTSTLDTAYNLGILYRNQGKLKKAEEMYLRALRGFEEALGAKNTSTLDAVHCLGKLYSQQGKLKEAEEMLVRALRGYEEAWGAKHTSTLDTVYGLGNLYRDQGEVVKAKHMYERAAEGYEDAEVDREAHIAYIREQLSLLVATDSEAERDCQPISQQPLISPADIPTQASLVPASDLANARSAGGKPPVRHRKRDFFLRALKR